MSFLNSFQQVSPIAADTIARFAERAPAGAVEAWGVSGAGFLGDDGYVRFVDPGRAAEMLEGVIGVPEGAVVLFVTGLGDLVVHANGVYLVVKSRWGAIDVIQGASFDQVVASLVEPADRDRVWEWEPYPEAVAREGVPAFEQCFGFAPLLALGGSSSADHLQMMGVWEHLAVIAQLVGPPQVRRLLELSGAVS